VGRNIDPQHPAIAQAVARGLLPTGALPAGGRQGKREKPELVEASATAVPNFGFAWVIPCEVPSLANSRDWRTRNRVTQAHRRAVSRALGRHLTTLAYYAEHYHRGGVLRVTLTRLGGKALDRTANLPAALKYIEDAVCLMLGADDGAANWVCRCEQEPGGKVGVRVTIETA
jgi:hypothetical protein